MTALLRSTVHQIIEAHVKQQGKQQRLLYQKSDEALLEYNTAPTFGQPQRGVRGHDRGPSLRGRCAAWRGLERVLYQ